jgi:hypothetical protein
MVYNKMTIIKKYEKFLLKKSSTVFPSLKNVEKSLYIIRFAAKRVKKRSPQASFFRFT